MTDKFTGSCHCGKIKFEVTAVLTGAMACNCSICVRKGALMWFVPRSDLRLLTSPEQIATYTFHKHIIKHHFCPKCGIHPFGEGVDTQGNAMAAVNIRCLEDIETENIPVQRYDGKSA
jgi:hypothetical protein